MKLYLKSFKSEGNTFFFQQSEPTALIFAPAILSDNRQLIKLLLPEGSSRLTGRFFTFVFSVSVVFKGSPQQQPKV